MTLTTPKLISIGCLASPTGDARLRREKYLSELVGSLYCGRHPCIADQGLDSTSNLDFVEKAISVWQTTTKHYKASYVAWMSYTDMLMFVLSFTCHVFVELTLFFDTFPDERINTMMRAPILRFSVQESGLAGSDLGSVDLVRTSARVRCGTGGVLRYRSNGLSTR